MELWAFSQWLKERHHIYYRLRQTEDPIPACGDPRCQYKDLESNGMLLKSTPPVIVIYLGGPDPFLSLAHEVGHLSLGIENGPDLEKAAMRDVEEYRAK
jgi:hypothetical protein